MEILTVLFIGISVGLAVEVIVAGALAKPQNYVVSCGFALLGAAAVFAATQWMQIQGQVHTTSSTAMITGAAIGAASIAFWNLRELAISEQAQPMSRDRARR